jgi:threonine aldolase
LGLNHNTFLQALKERGVSMGAVGRLIRAITHLDVSAEDIETAITAVADVARVFNGATVSK